MSPAGAVRPAPHPRHWYAVPGGAPAVLGSAGALAACLQAGLKFNSFGGTSGGAWTALFAAHGQTPGDMLRLTVATSFSGLLKFKPGKSKLDALYRINITRDRYRYTRPPQGIFTTTFADFIAKHLPPVWPDKFWTMAVDGKGRQVVFTSKGVFAHSQCGGAPVQVSDQPAPLGAVIAATSAVPGIFDSVELHGLTLHDGDLSWEGDYPISAIPHHFDCNPQDVLICDVQHCRSRWIRARGAFWAWVHRAQVPPEQPPADVFVVRPDLQDLSTLDFRLTEQQKWRAVQEGFRKSALLIAQRELVHQRAAQELVLLSDNLSALMTLP